ncbi:MAG: alkaline phosphatase D family protein, partial [Actinobacteria bacterium]|nr:alkaline phosphatase D family protein [Actinomycetota bacterium]
MEPISRRLFLAGAAAVVVGACSGDDDPPITSGSSTAGAPTTVDAPSTTSATTSAPTTSDAAPGTTAPAIVLPDDPFTLGVASGDPTDRTVVLWTRLAPQPLTPGGGMPPDDIAVDWEIAVDPAFTDVRWHGSVTANATHAHSVHVRAEIDAGGPYHYRFHAGGHTSASGRTRTAPAAGDEPESVRFASASCQNYQDGYYTAHADIAAQEVDFVVFLGDYIYEGAAADIGVNDVVRTHGTAACTTLDDYRARYALYKADTDLQSAHHAAPWFVTWDDHEVANNYAGSEGDDPTFLQRRRAAYQAWWEHQPVDLPPPPDDPAADYPIYRSMRWGSLVSMAILDGRQYRSEQACGGGTLNLDPACPEAFDETRSMIGDPQEAWLFAELGTTPPSTWHVIAQQTVFGDVTLGEAVLNYDQWDGYPVQRNRIVDRLAGDSIGNVVVLTGDIHVAATGVIRSGGRGTGTPVGVEFVA